MGDSTELERRYRRLVACYPRGFRRDHERELLSVLMDCSGDGQERPGLIESADLIKSAAWMRVRPGAPRSAPTVFAAVRLMYLAAALELCALITVLVTAGELKSAIIARNPHFTAAQWHAVLRAHVLPLEIGAPIAAGLLLWVAWANGRGHNWGRIAFAGLFLLTTISLLSGVAQQSGTYAPADLTAGIVLWLVALAALLLIVNDRSAAHYGQKPART
jgi:hypothetical protein